MKDTGAERCWPRLVAFAGMKGWETSGFTKYTRLCMGILIRSFVAGWKGNLRKIPPPKDILAPWLAYDPGAYFFNLGHGNFCRKDARGKLKDSFAKFVQEYSGGGFGGATDGPAHDLGLGSVGRVGHFPGCWRPFEAGRISVNVRGPTASIRGNVFESSFSLSVAVGFEEQKDGFDGMPSSRAWSRIRFSSRKTWALNFARAVGRADHSLGSERKRRFRKTYVLSGRGCLVEMRNVLMFMSRRRF